MDKPQDNVDKSSAFKYLDSTLPTVATTPSSSSTSGVSTSPTVGSEATTTAAPTVASSPSPSSSTPVVKPTGNASCNETLGACAGGTLVKPGGNNITIAPGVVLTPNGEIILTPHLPLLPGAGQTTASKPYPEIFPALLAGLAAATGTAGVTGAAGTAGGATSVAGQGAPQTSSTAQQIYAAAHLNEDCPIAGDIVLPTSYKVTSKHTGDVENPPHGDLKNHVEQAASLDSNPTNKLDDFINVRENQLVDECAFIRMVFTPCVKSGLKALNEFIRSAPCASGRVNPVFRQLSIPWKEAAPSTQL
ncbi:hypothetical protein AWC38_SpisGene15405 [Stylophora pistillata]|uniref:Uncharacterized protein n=1 Tax=Stylophora pistillata TaxID=50429 RepID=A0A2B4RUY6_STYPI|nr:hypothetical protein AWC38_SpisGene15405 [Stylophora pistillata]